MDKFFEFLFAVFSKVAQIWLICGELCFAWLLVAVFLFGVWASAFLIHVSVRTEPTQADVPRTERRTGWHIRATASLIDVILSWTGPFIVLIATFSAMRWHNANGFAGSWSGPYFAVDSLLWWTLGIGLSAGCIVWWATTLQRAQTPGKRIFGIRAVRSDTGQPLGWKTMFVREFPVKWFPFWFCPFWFSSIWHLLGFEPVGDLIDYWPGAEFINNYLFLIDLIMFAIMLLVVFPFDNLWPLWDKDNQTLHDKLVRTYIVRVPGR